MKAMCDKWIGLDARGAFAGRARSFAVLGKPKFRSAECQHLSGNDI